MRGMREESGGFTGTEVSLSPGSEGNLAVRLATLGKSKGEGSRAADNLAVLVVLAAVAGAAELVGSLVPGHNASQVSANGINTELLKSLVIIDNKVGGIALKTLDEGAVAGGVGLEPLLDDDVIAEGILGDETCAGKSYECQFSGLPPFDMQKHLTKFFMITQCTHRYIRCCNKLHLMEIQIT